MYFLFILVDSSCIFGEIDKITSDRVFKLWASFVHSQGSSLSYENISEIFSKFLDEFLLSTTNQNKSLQLLSNSKNIDDINTKLGNQSNILENQNNQMNNNNNNNSSKNNNNIIKIENNKPSQNLIHSESVKIKGIKTSILIRIIVDNIVYSEWNINPMKNDSTSVKNKNVSMIPTFIYFMQQNFHYTLIFLLTFYFFI